jgi:eukaryotic-like serine/threonine-protein kinase
MSTGEGDSREDRLASLMAGYDEALAAGQTPPSDVDASADADLRHRAREAREALRALEAVWPRAGPAPDPVRTPTADGPGPLAHLGRFQILGELGRGGFGVVFLALDPSLGRKVALKVPRPEVLVTPGVRRRFLREAEAAARLDHPNLVPIYEAGQVGPICYIASAYCEGPTLAGWLKRHPGPVPPPLAARLVADLAGAVQHAHGRGILHRDLKPSNILLQGASQEGGRAADDDPGFTPRVADFGLAKILDREGSETRSGLPIGSPPYMAPEQAEGRSADIGPATDVYALGAILYELLTGRPPFRGASVLETLELVRSCEPEPPSRLRPGLPRDLETICLTCLRKDAAARYDGAASLADDLRRSLAGEPIRARPDGPLDRIGRWCLRPERVANAGWSMIVLAVSLSAFAVATIAATALGLLRLERPRALYVHGLRCIFGVYLPMIWLGRNAIRRKPWAVWACLVFSILGLLVVLASMSGVELADLGGGPYSDPTSRFPFESLVATLVGLQVLACSIALAALRSSSRG